ncbi:MAG: N-6 DNA methylase [Candidatus Omnitrophica bacterium]|nr:N-6 DNA methylase [Candidatus Omnitrophota bacterium]
MTKKLLPNTNHASLLKFADELVLRTKDLLREAKTEEDLRIGFEKLLESIRAGLNLKSTPRYEKSVYSGRSDAVHGQVIIEYEPPNSFSSRKNIDHAYEQLVNYLSDETEATKLTQVGVGFDGAKIFFVQYQGKNDERIDRAKFFIRGPYDFNPESARTFLIHLRALSRLPLTAENLAQKFGPQSELAPKMVSALANALAYWGDQTHIRTFFNEWKRLFGIVYGEQFTGGQQEKEAEKLSKLYRVGTGTDFQELLFSVHTYFALLMKLIAAELLTLRETSFGSSLASQFTHISDDELKQQLENIENGGIYSQKGITNFLEGDFFRWYLDAFDSPELKEAIREIARCLSEFEPATSTLDPVSTRDLLKKLYQYLVPQEVRHRLGEYYTPDWLAELLLNEVGYDGNTLKRFLDPACGSGTFLVLAIQRAIEHGREKEKIPDLEIGKRILANIWGFDLNPLAVIAARTNYLFALGDLINEILSRGGKIEIPVYLADSVLWPEQVGGQIQLNFYGGDYVKVKTSVKEFHVPAIWIQDKGFRMQEAASMIEDFTKAEFEPEIAMKHFKKRGLAFSPNEQIVENFYKEVLELEKKKQNGIWARFLKNAFAPMVAGKFDFVVGNPPWILWEYLSKEYREATQNLWDDYGLTRIGQTRNVLIRGRRDFSMLFVYASADYYLKGGAKLGFLITQEVFKSKGAGEGFRRFQLGDKEYLKVLKAHDLVSIQPFEGAANKTAVIILKRGEKTEYPLPYFIWTKKKSVSKIATDKLLDEVLPLLQKKKYSAKPIGSDVGAWQTQIKEAECPAVEGQNYYKAKIGVVVSPYSVFWLKVKQVLSNGDLLINNLNEEGKVKVPIIEATIEHELVYPAIKSSDITRWLASPEIFVLITHPASQIPHNETTMRNRWPKIYSYLLNFKDILAQMALYKHFHEPVGNPFYGQRNIGEHVFSLYKVVWRRQASDISAAVVSQHKTLFGYRPVVVLDPSVLISTNSESEAHYLCAIINSKPVRDFIKSFSSAGRGFGTPSVMEHVGIPKFNPKNPLHKKLSEISKKCHRLKAAGKEKELEKLEEENDELVKKLFLIK